MLARTDIVESFREYVVVVGIDLEDIRAIEVTIAIPGINGVEVQFECVENGGAVAATSSATIVTSAAISDGACGTEVTTLITDGDIASGLWEWWLIECERDCLAVEVASVSRESVCSINGGVGGPFGACEVSLKGFAIELGGTCMSRDSRQ